jgi:hypothetical protein
MNIRKWVYRKWVHSNWQYMLKVLILQCLNIIKHSIHLTGPRDHDGDHRVCLPVNFAPYPIHIRWLWTHFYRFRIFGVFRILLKTEHLRSTHTTSAIPIYYIPIHLCSIVAASTLLVFRYLLDVLWYMIQFPINSAYAVLWADLLDPIWLNDSRFDFVGPR